MVLVAVVCLIVCPVVCPIWCAPKVSAQEPQQPGRIGIGALAKAPDAVWIESLIEADAAELAVEVCRFHFDRSVPDSNAQAQWLMLLMHAKAAESLGKIEWNSGVKPLQDAMEQLQGLDPKPSALGEATSTLECALTYAGRTPFSTTP
jgi:hypothetical protein